MILVEAEIVAVEAEVNIEAAIAVIIGDGGVGEASFGRFGEAESIALDLEGAIAAIEKEERKRR